MENENIEISEIVKAIKISKEYIKIKKDLIKQLKLMKANIPTFLSQINDYMSMWVVKELLIRDIETRGVIASYNNGGGQSGMKKNDSVTDQIKVNAQMLKLLDALNIKSTTLVADEKDEM
ncbi:RNA polymerase subunit sigma-70 [Clostridium tagluense]|uniref:RNA polymerase subunit sigma-70 n=1 Tax=Clostridium tagluense TaxID=360422 RepID=UPI001CF4C0FF|nr:RNA polymerase subunit sigma-70 [Clostridium tagluense]MCB2311616.1 RNA polymerase subunit sigma-70 [Clostridium tagluense]MCB2316340.1 RNA polymerase subunit sigma-70 [Clostridium tagluense]MCB2321276.1 RNA polymerase subunit sigma-70 [Clostridium tagluense]MCB2326209.1 RNA polymerase subunit sigma-70 [Clostridium tagluense]MCB2331012.1 RNA polymerase subunit sigma-70 [Clostridium tagluense]